MNMQQAREEFGIGKYTHSTAFVESTRDYENQVRNFENAVVRLKDRGQTNRRPSAKRARTGAALGETLGTET